MVERELDVRGLRKPDKHPPIFSSRTSIRQSCQAGQASGDLHRVLALPGVVRVNNHDPKHPGHEFAADYPGSYGWEYVESAPRVWLPRRARRRFSAGRSGLRYLTVHRRREAPVLETPPVGTAQ